MAGAVDGIAEAAHFALPDEVDIGHFGDLADGLELGCFAAFFELGFEFEAAVEVFFNGTFAASDDDDDVGNAGLYGFGDDVLDDRGVDDGQHFLGLCFGGGEEAGSESGGGNDGFPYHEGVPCVWFFVRGSLFLVWLMMGQAGAWRFQVMATT